MCRLFPCIPILGCFFFIEKCKKKYVFVVGLKIELWQMNCSSLLRNILTGKGINKAEEGIVRAVYGNKR